MHYSRKHNVVGNDLVELYADMHPQDQRWMREIADAAGKTIPDTNEEDE